MLEMYGRMISIHLLQLCQKIILIVLIVKSLKEEVEEQIKHLQFDLKYSEGMLGIIKSNKEKELDLFQRIFASLLNE